MQTPHPPRTSQYTGGNTPQSPESPTVFGWSLPVSRRGLVDVDALHRANRLGREQRDGLAGEILARPSLRVDQ
jgi:hypothetical protein